MTIYTSRPKPRRARQVWDYIVEHTHREPKALWKNANAWGAGRGVTGNAWGLWVGEMDRADEYYCVDPKMLDDLPKTLSPE